MIPYAVMVVTLVWSIYRDVQNRKDNRKNQTALTGLEEGKLDLGVAELGHKVFVDTVAELRTLLNECHTREDRLRTALRSQGLRTDCAE